MLENYPWGQAGVSCSDYHVQNHMAPRWYLQKALNMAGSLAMFLVLASLALIFSIGVGTILHWIFKW